MLFIQSIRIQVHTLLAYKMDPKMKEEGLPPNQPLLMPPAPCRLPWKISLVALEIRPDILIRQNRTAYDPKTIVPT